MESSGDISRSIQILSPRINKMNHIIRNIWIIGLSWWIMNHSSVWASWTNSIKTKTFIVFKLMSSCVNIFCCLILIDFLLFGSPCPEFYLSNCVSNMTVSISINLLVCSDSSIKSDTLPFDWLFQKWKKIMIQWTFFYQSFLWKLWIIFT